MASMLWFSIMTKSFPHCSLQFCKNWEPRYDINTGISSALPKWRSMRMEDPCATWQIHSTGIPRIRLGVQHSAMHGSDLYLWWGERVSYYFSQVKEPLSLLLYIQEPLFMWTRGILFTYDALLVCSLLSTYALSQRCSVYIVQHRSLTYIFVYSSVQFRVV